MKGRPAPAMGLLRQIDALARGTFPSRLTALLLVLAAVPVGLPGLVPAGLPALHLLLVSVPPGRAAAARGVRPRLAAGSVTSAPVGSGVLTLLVVQGLAMRWRPFLARHSFLVVWLVYCGVAAGAATLGWVLHGDAAAGGCCRPRPACSRSLLTAGSIRCWPGC